MDMQLVFVLVLIIGTLQYAHHWMQSQTELIGFAGYMLKNFLPAHRCIHYHSIKYQF